MTKAEASRTNGAKSNGPITSTGKSISAQNARTHGLTGGAVVLAHESKTDYDALLASFLNRYRPSDETECDLIREMVIARWRLRRIEAMETALMQKAIDDQMSQLGEGADPNLAQFLAYAEVAENSKGLRLLNRYAKDLRRSYEKALQEFLDMHEDEAQPNEEAEALAEIAAAMQSLGKPSGSFRQPVHEARDTEEPIAA